MRRGASAIVNGFVRGLTRFQNPHFSAVEYWSMGFIRRNGVLIMSGKPYEKAASSNSSCIAPSMKSSGSIMDTYKPDALSSPWLTAEPYPPFGLSTMMIRLSHLAIFRRMSRVRSVDPSLMARTSICSDSCAKMLARHCSRYVSTLYAGMMTVRSGADIDSLLFNVARSTVQSFQPFACVHAFFTAHAVLSQENSVSTR